MQPIDRKNTCHDSRIIPLSHSDPYVFNISKHGSMEFYGKHAAPRRGNRPERVLGSMYWLSGPLDGNYVGALYFGEDGSIDAFVYSKRGFGSMPEYLKTRGLRILKKSGFGVE